jgi:hypothetical protein
MTRSGENGDKVGLSVPTWIGLITLAIAIVGPGISSYISYEKRVTTLETTSTEHGRRLGEGDQRDIALRQEILAELKELRTQVTK